MSSAGELTARLQAWRSGDAAARDALDAEVYAALKRMARGRLAGQAPATLDPTALVHEAVARLLDSSVDATSRTHFYALAALQMRSVLVDHARRLAAAKRPSSDARVSIDEIDLAMAEVDLVGLDEALRRLSAINPRQARVVDLKFFAGMELDEIADVLDVARPTVVRDWRMARAWLQRELGG